jgi:hypothetical protein
VSKHTPTPWAAYGTTLSTRAEGPRSLIGTTDPLRHHEEEEQNAANAAHIVKCVNAHDELVAALKGMLEAWEEQFGEGACDCRPEPENAGHVCQCCLAKLAIEQAEGGAK